MLSVIQPPSSGPITGATSVVMAHIASASAGQRLGVARQQQRLRQRDHRPGHEPLQRRGTTISISMLGARPHSHEASTNSSTLVDEQPHLAEALRQPAGQRHRDRVGHARSW